MTRFILITRRDAAVGAVLLLACVLLCFVNFSESKMLSSGTKEAAVVISVDNSEVYDLGVAQQGSQVMEVEVLSGDYKGKRFRAANQLRAQLELDKLFSPGDKVLVAIFDGADPQKDTLNAQDYYRINYTYLLFGLFALLLIIFGGITGFNALLSFVFSCLTIWKLVIPLCLAGYNALVITGGAVVLLSVVIILLVAGLTKKGAVSLAGTLLGVLASSIFAYEFTHLFRINGAVMPFSQALLNCGYDYLNLADIYIGAIFLSSSGAVMDLAMDVASGMQEVINKRPELNRRELLGCGIRIGRSVVGTMTTTLLLAYSGGYLTLMMMFSAQGTKPIDFINNPYVASEIVKTLIGSFGLVLVAPFTAFAGALIFAKKV